MTRLLRSFGCQRVDSPVLSANDDISFLVLDQTRRRPNVGADRSRAIHGTVLSSQSKNRRRRTFVHRADKDGVVTYGGRRPDFRSAEIDGIYETAVGDGKSVEATVQRTPIKSPVVETRRRRDSVARSELTTHVEPIEIAGRAKISTKPHRRRHSRRT